MLPVYRTPLHIFNYDEIPPGYYYKAMREGAASQRFWHRQKFLAVSNHVPDTGRVLDLGCGPGSFLSILCETHPSIQAVGLDIASSQIDFAMKEVAPRFEGRIRFEQYDAAKGILPYPDQSFDTVTSIEVVEHIHPYVAHQMLSEARRVLKPGGRLVATTPNYRSLWPLVEVALELLSPVKYHEQHINKFTPNSFVKFLETVGYQVSDLETIFIAAPFAAAISENLSKGLLALEKKAPWRLGSLLVASCVNNPNLVASSVS